MIFSKVSVTKVETVHFEVLGTSVLDAFVKFACITALNFEQLFSRMTKSQMLAEVQI